MRWTPIVMLLLSGCREEAEATALPPAETKPAETAEEEARKPPKPEPPPEPTLQEKLAKADHAEAMRLVGPLLEDEVNRISAGTAALGLWAMQNMKWSDVAVASNETSLAKIHKDSDTERGKRMCVRGKIVQITADKSSGVGTAYIGLMTAPSFANIVHYVAVADTGDLVENSPARFCGIVTGRYSYSNSGGGTTHAVGLVGMFDLPSNRKAE